MQMQFQFNERITGVVVPMHRWNFLISLLLLWIHPRRCLWGSLPAHIPLASAAFL